MRLAEVFSKWLNSKGGHLVLEHVHVVVGGLGLLLRHLLQVRHQVWHVHPELLRGGIGLCGVAENET